MAVPDTNTFTMQDVKANVSGSPNDLVDAFTKATDSAFDPSYKGSKDSLLNFRNYDETPTVHSILFSSARQSSAEVCGLTPNITRYCMRAGILSNGDRIYTNSAGTTPFNGQDQFYKTDRDSGDQWVEVDTDGYVTSNGYCS